MLVGIPVTSFAVKDLDKTHAELADKGVTFVQPSTAMGPMMSAVLDDTCGNLIMIAGPESPSKVEAAQESGS